MNRAPQAEPATPTPSLRRRATAATLGLFAVLLLIVGFSVDIALGSQLRSELDTRLADRVDRAHTFTEEGDAAPQDLPALLGGRDVRVAVTLPDGSSFGDPGLVAPATDAPASQGEVAATSSPAAPPAPPGPKVEPGPRGGPREDGPGPGGGPRGPAADAAPPAAVDATPEAVAPAPTGDAGAVLVDPADGTTSGPTAQPDGTTDSSDTGAGDLPADGPAVSSTSVTEILADGSRVLLVADTRQIDDVRANLRAIMLVSGLVVLALAAVVLVAAVARALRPLDRLTTVAGQISAGDRGRRLRPDRAGTELGRAAVAFDGMLDELESTESRARRSAADANDAAERARRAEDRTRRFLSDAAHELRTPLAGMQAVAEQMLARSPGAEDPNHRRVTLLMRETNRTSRLVTDMLDLARIDSGLPLQPVAADLAAIVDGEVERMRTLSPGLTVDRAGDTGPVPVVVDPGRIAQILANLGDNARRHAPPGGTITVDVAGGVVTVTDTGPGVPPDEQERIFERLVRLDDARDRESGGAGLGLAIARGLARAHGGELTYVPDTPGARFRLTLPTG